MPCYLVYKIVHNNGKEYDLTGTFGLAMWVPRGFGSIFVAREGKIPPIFSNFADFRYVCVGELVYGVGIPIVGWGEK